MKKTTIVQRDRDRRDGGADVDVGRAYNELFFDQGSQLARLNGTIRTSMIIDPPDGHIPPLTPEAEKRQEALRAEARLIPPMGPKIARSPSAAFTGRPQVRPCSQARTTTSIRSIKRPATS